MDEPSQLSVPHVTVSMSNTFSDEWKTLRCVLCGGVVCQHNDDYVRSITFSGEPILERPGKIVQCAGVLSIYRPKDAFEVVYELLDTILKTDDISTIRAKAIELARDNHKTSKMCKAKYYIG